jgi:hypothetical protein
VIAKDRTFKNPSDRVLNFEFMSGDHTFKSQRIAHSAVKVIALSKTKVIAILKLNQQEKDDRTTISAITLSNLVLNSCHIVLP